MTCSLKVQLGLSIFLLQAPELLECLLNKTNIQNTAMNSKAHHGDIFYATYRRTLNHHLVQKAKEVIPMLAKHARKESASVGNIFVGMLEYTIRDKEIRKKYDSYVPSIQQHLNIM